MTYQGRMKIGDRFLKVGDKYMRIGPSGADHTCERLGFYPSSSDVTIDVAADNPGVAGYLVFVGISTQAPGVGDNYDSITGTGTIGNFAVDFDGIDAHFFFYGTAIDGSEGPLSFQFAWDFPQAEMYLDLFFFEGVTDILQEEHDSTTGDILTLTFDLPTVGDSATFSPYQQADSHSVNAPFEEIGPDDDLNIWGYCTQEIGVEEAVWEAPNHTDFGMLDLGAFAVEFIH